MSGDEVTHPLPGAATPLSLPPGPRAVADALLAAGGRPVAVGGCVRDHLLGRDAHDIDIECYALDEAALTTALETVGSVHAVGRSFGVLKVSAAGEVVDVALPRTESKEGRGHRGFLASADPHLPFEVAAARRDFTCNAMGVDLTDGALLDPHGGQADLAAGRLRHVSPAFAEDPLRVLRACQFAARFALTIHDDTLALCKSLEPELATLPAERLYEELKKVLRAPWPSLGLAALGPTGALSLFPELAAMQNVPQEPEWHPEGDVFTHTLLVVDEAARLCRQQALPEDEALRVLFGALCHDLGKPATTTHEDGRIKSKNHESEGEPPTRSFMARLGAPKDLVDDVVDLVRDHLKPFQLYKDRDVIKDGAIRRLAVRVPIDRLCRVARADHFGRTTKEALAHDDPASPWLQKRAQDLHAYDQRPQPLLQGRHLIARGHKPGRAFRPVLDAAFSAQLDGAFADLDEAEAWLDDHIDQLFAEAEA